MTLLEDLTARALAKDGANGWTRTVVDELPEMRDPDLLRPYRRAFMGPAAVTIMDSRERRVVGQPISAGELARLYLKTTMTQAAEASGRQLLAKRVPYRSPAKALRDRRPAYYFGGEQGGPWSVVDVRACYASIYSRLTLDMTYRPDCSPPLIGLGRVSFPRVREWLATKGPRNAMFGTLVRPNVREWRHGEPKDTAQNRYHAPDLVGIIFDTAHAIAVESVEKFGAVSWAVDGGCIRPDRAQAWIDWLASRWGLAGEVRAEGPGWLFGPTSWQVGGDATLDVLKGRAHRWQPSDSLLRQDKKVRDWLAGTMKEREL